MYVHHVDDGGKPTILCNKCDEQYLTVWVCDRNEIGFECKQCHMQWILNTKTLEWFEFDLVMGSFA
jgi:hypothetical protein